MDFNTFLLFQNVLLPIGSLGIIAGFIYKMYTARMKKKLLGTKIRELEERVAKLETSRDNLAIEERVKVLEDIVVDDEIRKT